MIPISTAPPETLGATSVQPTTTQSSGGFLSALESAVNPFSGSSFIPNALLILVGIALGLGALLISQKETVISVARTAAEV